jgi:hypothetical protein
LFVKRQFIGCWLNLASFFSCQLLITKISLSHVFPSVKGFRKVCFRFQRISLSPKPSASCS